MTLIRSVASGAASAGGAVLGAAARGFGAVRPTAKPLHPRGRVVRARLERTGLTPALGVPFLDEAGEDEVLVRVSRAVGLPAPLPDIHGLAVRVPLEDGGYGDLLFATTGWGRWTRYLLTASREPDGRPLTTLLPYRTTSGPLLLGARHASEGVVELACASAGGDWRMFGRLLLSVDDAGDATTSFDPVRNQVPGLEVPGWVRRLREPAYDAARRSRD